MAQLLALVPPQDESGGLAPRALPIEPQALKIWIAAHDRIEQQLGRGGDLQEIKATAAKGAENLLRIAGIMAVVEESGTLTPALIERAAVLVTWYLDEALRVGHPVKVEARLLQAQRLLDWLRANEWQSFEARDLQRKGPRFARKSATLLKELLGILVEHRQLLLVDGRVFRLVPGGDNGDTGDRPDAARA